MKTKIVNITRDRIWLEITDRNPLVILRKEDPSTYIDGVIAAVYMYTRGEDSTPFVGLISAIGSFVLKRIEAKNRGSALAAKVGAFLLYSFEASKILHVVLGKTRGKHAAYIVKLDNDEAIVKLWTSIRCTEAKLPSEVPFEDWTSAVHPSGAKLVKTDCKEVLEKLTPKTHSIVFECVNKAQRVGWCINKDIYLLSLWALRYKTEAFSDIWEAASAEARKTKLREAYAIEYIAKMFLKKPFYHIYTLDFRGRKYAGSAYLHEQGSDLARGLLLREDKKAIGEAGFFWLMVNIASTWAGDAGRRDGAKTDKIPLQDRFDWAANNEDILLSYAEHPKVHRKWMSADKPWQFLAACNELLKLRKWQYANGDFENYNYESHLEVFVDGSNNGSQHLAALTLDEETAPLVNLVPSDLPGDLYEYVARHVWASIDNIVAQMSKKELDYFNKLINEVTDLKVRIGKAEKGSVARATLVSNVKLFREKNQEALKVAAPVYWSRFKDKKQQRKIVKR